MLPPLEDENNNSEAMPSEENSNTSAISKHKNTGTCKTMNVNKNDLNNNKLEKNLNGQNKVVDTSSLTNRQIIKSTS